MQYRETKQLFPEHENTYVFKFVFAKLIYWLHTHEFSYFLIPINLLPSYNQKPIKKDPLTRDAVCVSLSVREGMKSCNAVVQEQKRAFGSWNPGHYILR